MKNIPLSSDNLALSVMDRLKLETRDHHTQTENITLMQRLFAHDYTLSEYQQHLEKMYGYFSVLEPVILQALKQEPSLHGFFLVRSKQVWLKQDLLNFGLTEAQIVALPQCPIPSYITDLSSALGVCYVLEGSNLGGQVILKQLSDHFGETVRHKLRFYQGYGAETRPQWQQFCTLLNAHFSEAQQANVNQAVTAAKLTFDSLTNWLESSAT